MSTDMSLSNTPSSLYHNWALLRCSKPLLPTKSSIVSRLAPAMRTISDEYGTSTVSFFDGVWGPVSLIFLSNVGIDSAIECSAIVFHTCLGNYPVSSSLIRRHMHLRFSAIIPVLKPYGMHSQWHNALVCAAVRFIMASSVRCSVALITPHRL